VVLEITLFFLVTVIFAAYLFVNITAAITVIAAAINGQM